jgi:hypothetical protein
MTRDQRRSARRLLGALAEVHVGPVTVRGEVHDVSREGMGLWLPPGTAIRPGDTVWLVVEFVATYAITGTVLRIDPGGRVGLELHEVLAGDALERVERLPLAQAVPPAEELAAPPDPDGFSATPRPALETAPLGVDPRDR